MVEDEGKTPRSIYRTVGSGGSFGASPLEQHIGLGKSAKILSLEVWWPTSNTRQNFTEVPTKQFLQITEFEPKYIKLQRNEVKLGRQQQTATAEIKK